MIIGLLSIGQRNHRTTEEYSIKCVKYVQTRLFLMSDILCCLEVNTNNMLTKFFAMIFLRLNS